MVLWFRTIWLIFRSLFKPKSELLDEAKSSFRVHLIDTDFPHFDGMSNGRYFNIMDLARVEHVIRVGIMKQMLRHGWFILVGGQCIRYRKTLKRWQRYEVRSRILGWDNKWFYVTQWFERKGEIYAVGTVRALFRDSKGNIPPDVVAKSAGFLERSPHLDHALSNWLNVETELFGSPTGMESKENGL